MNLAPKIIAIDGPAAAGKGTLAMRLSKHFGLELLDTGLLYRAVGLKVLKVVERIGDDLKVYKDVASRAAKERCDAGFRVNKTGEAVYLDFASAITRYGKEQAHVKGLNEDDPILVKKLGQQVVRAKYGNLFQMYEKIVDQNPYETPMMIYPAVHYTMGGVWVDYNLMTTIPGCYAIGEANFSDHGANPPWCVSFNARTG